jgi:drug/metabolite transporter (DMT)-like permease
MVIDHPGKGETVFGLFATRARQRSLTSLLEQLIACTLAGLFLVVFASPWWPVGAALGAAASYAAWGLLDRRPRSRVTRAGLRVLAALTTVFAFVAVVGVGLAAFTGDGRSPYGSCTDANGRTFACNARGERRR